MTRFTIFKPLFVLWLLTSSLIVFADPLGEAERALNNGNYEQAMSLFKPLADEGEPGAMIGLGRMFQSGHGVEKNHDVAMSWFSKAITIWNERAKQNDARAFASLGVLFNKGIAFKKDKGRARQYFKTAFDIAKPKALQGDNDSQHLIGMLYSSGKGVRKDILAGIDWLGKAGEGGNETSIKMLIHIFDSGSRGVPKDDKKTEYWRSKLAALEEN